MKKLFYILLALFIGSCEDVIEVDVPQEAPRLVVEALFRVDTNEPFVPVVVKLTTTNSFFDEITATSADDNITILIDQYEDREGIDVIISSGSSSLSETEPGSGIYVPDPTFMNDQRISSIGLNEDMQFTMIIPYQGRRYAAQTRYVPSTPIDNLAQGTETLFDEDETEVVITYTDDPNRSNYYVFDFGFGDYFGSEDTFYQGQPFSFSYFYDQIFDPGTELEISILGADQEFFNYMNLLVEQSDDDFNIFDTPVATVRGNVFDITDLDNIEVLDNVDQPNSFALGYFAIVEEHKATLTIQ
jgi:hypothetical protein